MISPRKKISKCYVIGNGSLAFECVKKLFYHSKYQLLGLITSDKKIEKWCEANNISKYGGVSDWLATKDDDFDFLFSIANDQLLPKAVLKRPSVAAINYHDSLLPTYAGVHATSWAILNNEREHGVTWHLMSEQIDTGPILKQKSVDIAPEDTAQLLNLKCFSTALELFHELIEELTHQDITPTPQNLNQRSYYSYAKKPPNMGFIDFTQSAENIAKMWRALYFGNVNNSLASCKLLTEQGWYIIEELHVEPNFKKQVPGKVIDINAQFIRIASATDDIVITSLKTIRGQLLSIQDFMRVTQIKCEDMLVSPESDMTDRLIEQSEILFTHEKYWVNEWLRINPQPLPYFSYLEKQATIHKKYAINLGKNVKNWKEFVLSLWVAYLFRLTGQSQVSLGLLDYRLNTGDVNKDFFSDLLPFTIELSTKDTFGNLISMVSSKLVDIKKRNTYLTDVFFRYPDLSNLGSTVAEAFPVVVEYVDGESEPEPEPELGNPFGHKPCLKLILDESKKQLTLELFQVNGEALNANFLLKQIGAHIMMLEHHAENNPDEPIIKLNCLTKKELNALLKFPGQVSKKYLTKNIIELFEEQVKCFGDKKAIRCKENFLTYKELDLQSTKLMECLVQKGLKAKERVVIFHERTIEVIVSMLAILKANCSYVPISPEYPPKRVRYTVAESDAKFILTSNQLYSKIKSIVSDANIEIIDVGNYKLDESINLSNNHNVLDRSTPDDIAYVLFTSGSTGEPKGVEVCHRGVVRLVKDQNYIDIKQDDVVAQFGNYVFDSSTFEIWGALLNGALLNIIRADDETDLEALADQVNESCTIFASTLTIFKDIFSAVPRFFNNLRVLQIGGEAIRAKDVKPLLAYKKKNNLNFAIYNMYGPTENTTNSLFYLIEKIPRGVSRIPIGKPIKSTEAYVLDQNLNLLPMGVPGVLYLSGDGLSKGYLKDPQRTADSFLKSPYSKTRLYKTGDIVRLREDGNFEFLGREDNQVKIRGVRIELEEVERTLLDCSPVTQAIVLNEELANNKEILVAYITVRGKRYSENTIRKFCQQQLPAEMIPAEIVVVDKIPYNDHHKVDRTALRKFRLLRSKSTHVPLKDKELLLSEVLKKLLRVNQVLREDNFFSLGGDSILAMQFVTEVKQRGWEIKSSDIFSHPTVSNLAKRLKKSSGKGLIKDSGLSRGVIPLAPIQSWYFSHNSEGQSVFNQSVLLRVKKSLNITVLEKAFDAVIQHHDMLRASYYQRDGGWFQVINESVGKFKIEVEEVTSENQKEKIELIESKLYAKAKKFDLAVAPLVNAVIYPGVDENFIYIAIHHLIMDGVSWRFLLDDIFDAYNSIDNIEAPIFSLKTSPYCDWSEHLNNYLNVKEVKKLSKLWLKEASSFQLPVDYNRGDNLEMASSKICSRMDLSKTKLTYNQVRPLDMLVTALVVVLRGWAKKKVVSFYIESHGRENFDGQFDLSRTLGWFTSLFPLKFDVKQKIDDAKLLSVLKNVREKLMALPRHGVDYGVLKYLIKDEKIQSSISSIEASSLCFNFLGNFDTSIGLNSNEFELVGTPMRLETEGSAERVNLINLTVWIKNNLLHVEWHFSNNHFNNETIQNLSDDYADVLARLGDQCLNSLSQTFVPADFPLAQISRNQLDYYLNKYPNLENIAGLSPIQNGLIFHHLQLNHSYIYHSQLIWRDYRDLDLNAFKLAWQEMVSRHEIFRSKFVWKRLDSPLQIIDSRSKLPWKTYDCTGLTDEEKETRIESIILEEHRKEFDFSISPLMRMCVVKLSDKEHVVIWTHHHILLGGWSINTVLKELYTIYSSMLENKAVTLPQPIPYTDYIKYHAGIANSLSSKRFWKKYLADFSSSYITNQIGDKNYLARLDYGSFECDLPFDVVVELKKFAKKHHVSLYTLMLFAWSYLISNYSDTDDVCVGVVISTRDYDEKYNDDMVGPMINTLPFRLSIDVNSSIKDSLKKVRSHISQAKRHSHTSLVDIHRWLKRSTRNPLFDTLFIFENYPLTFSDGHISDLIIKDITHYPLTLTVYPGDKIRLMLTHHKNILSHEMIKNIMSNYQVTLLNMIDSLSSKLSMVDVVSSNEKDRLFNLWNKTTKNYPTCSVGSRFELTATKHPNKTAISMGDTSITYASLNNLSKKWAAYLIEHGLKHGDNVGIYTNRSIEMIVIMLAVIRAGGVYVPFDDSIPVDRLEYIIKDADIRIVLSQPQYIRNLNAHLNYDIINILDDKKINNISDLPSLPTVFQDDVMYTIYTSGTTGAPKGIQVKHSGVVNAIFSVFDTLSATHEEKLLSITTIAFDISVLEIFGSLLWGMELILTETQAVMQPHKLIEIIQKKKPTLIQATPSYWELILDSGWRDGAHTKLLCGGEKLTDELALKLLNTGADLWNVYGPSETTIWSSISKMEFGKNVTIGKPLANTKFYVLDQHKRIVPIGVKGELYISGKGVAKGYLNRPDLNKEYFVKNTFDDEYSVLYKTGDIVQWLPNGELAYFHRIDNQIKLHGFRIELEEIRSVILQHPNIKDCLVIKLEGTYESSSLVAFYILKDPGKALAKNEINILLTPKLPYYMIPSKFISIPKFPLSPNGKIDTKKLYKNAMLNRTANEIDSNQVGNPTEQLIIELFCNTLKTKKVHLHDGFFDVGGDSITAIRLLSRIQEYFSITMTINEILSNQSPFEIARLIYQKRFLKRDVYEDIPSPVVSLQPKGSKPPLFIIHPVGGTIFWFIKLAKLLGEDRPIYGIQDPGLQTHKPHFTTFEAMASFYLKEIVQTYPSGPYLLSGASFGANMAIEVAKQLQESGAVVSFVGLLDGWQIYPDEVSTHEFLAQRMKIQYQQVKQKIKGFDFKNIRPVINITWHRSHLLANYKATWIDSPLVLFKASEILEEFQSIDSIDNHWGNHCPKLEVISVSGDHETMFYEPNVSELAKKINQSLEGKIDSNVFFPVDEVSQVPKAWSRGEIVNIEKNIIQLLEEVTESYPNEIAAVHDGTCITYDQLYDRTNQLANYLADLGVKKGDVVAICIERGFSMLIALIGVLKSGAAFSPIHLSSPPSKIEKIQANCRAVITQKSLHRKFNTDDKNVICIDRDWAYIMKKSTSQLQVSIDLSDKALILYSSVSLVEPRGIIVTHKNISNLISWSLSNFSKTELSGVLASTPLADDLAMFEIFSALCSGGCVHIVNNIQELSDAQFAENITLINTKPSYLKDVILNDVVPSSVQSLILSKEKLTREFVNEVFEITSIENIYNCFVQEEGGIVTCASIDRSNNENPSIGKPISNALVYVLDENLKPLPKYQVGNLYITGDVLSPGYFKNDMVLNKSFIKNSFNDGYKTLYKTGDRVRWLSSGELEFIEKNRKGLMLKGFIIELAEIEALLSQHPDISSATVDIEVDENDNQRLIIYFVASDSTKIPRYDDLTKFIKQFLFPFSYSCVFVQVDKLAQKESAH